jgi:AraC-like DNA-binding protein
VKVLPFTIPKLKRDTLIFQEDRGRSFYALLHQHEEFQISYIKKGEGSLIVGDTVNYYSEGDIVVLGKQVPHVFKSNINLHSTSQMFTLFFNRSSFGENFFDIEELSSLNTFFRRSENGFQVNSNLNEIRCLILELRSAPKIDRFITFIQLLKLINSSEHTPLSTFVSPKKYNDNEGKRMSVVFEYSINNFHKEIKLETIAAKAAMTKNAFCKYFKKRTNKTFITFLNEIRIEEASKRLVSNKDLSIAEVAESCGFKNISNFNRKFKQIKGKTPSNFKLKRGTKHYEDSR